MSFDAYDANATEGWFVRFLILHWFYIYHKRMEIHFWISSHKVLSKRQHFSSAHGWVSFTLAIAIDTTNNNWLNFLNKWPWCFANYSPLIFKSNTANTLGRRWTNSLSFILGGIFCVPTILLANCKFYAQNKEKFVQLFFCFHSYVNEMSFIHIWRHR